MRFWKTALWSSVGLYSAGCGYIYHITDGHMTPYRLFMASIRSNRVSFMGLRLYWLYKFSNKSSEEKHKEGARIMKAAFIKNGGLYIKLGQLIATVEENDLA